MIKYIELKEKSREYEIPISTIERLCSGRDICREN
jgi:hypothetical protein